MTSKLGAPEQAAIALLNITLRDGAD